MTPTRLTLADALPHELIVDLSRLRWLFVTARGSSFRFRDREIDVRDVGRLLGVRYCLSGFIERERSSHTHVSWSSWTRATAASLGRALRGGGR